MSNHSLLALSDPLMEKGGTPEVGYGRCPRCASTDLHLSRYRNMLERALGSIAQPWRCNICYARFFRPFWFKAEPKRMDLRRRCDRKTGDNGGHKRQSSARSGLLRGREQFLPRFIKRYPALAFLFPARSHVRDVKDPMSFGTK